LVNHLVNHVRLVALLAVTTTAVACNSGGYDATAAQSTTYAAALSGAKERPTPTSSSATGTASFTRTGSTIDYVVTTTPFGTPLTVGHLHVGGSSSVGPILVPFTIVAQSGMVATGTIDLSKPVTNNTVTISGDSLLVLFEHGNAYVNLSTAAFPGGEIRGQLMRQ
jgi:hypothetical protein